MFLGDAGWYRKLLNIVSENGWREIPKFVIDMRKVKVNTSTQRGTLEAVSKTSTVDFSGITNPFLRFVLQRYVINRIETKSNNEALAFWSEFRRFIMKSSSWKRINEVCDLDEEVLVSVFKSLFQELKDNKRLHRFYRISRWYIYCADHFDCLGFSLDYANTLASLRLPGNPKGEAVRSKDPDVGPINLKLELPLLYKALDHDTSAEIQHVEERVAVYLSVAFGRNPANIALLREHDLERIDEFPNEYYLNIPRIKKRTAKRSDFIQECPEAKLVDNILLLIELNGQFSTDVLYKGKSIELPRPLFFRKTPCPLLLESESPEYAFHVTSSYITSLVTRFAKRVGLVSPLTNQDMKLTVRRLRYTYATNMAKQGISRLALALLLDHSDTQHVDVYYELGDEIVAPLEKAAAKRIGRLLKFFKGKPITSDSEAVNGNSNDKKIPSLDNLEVDENIGVCGEKSLCELAPPLSCYLCSKFQPYIEADHEGVLDKLIEDRNSRLETFEKARLGIQLDDVIYAVAEVVRVIAGGKTSD